VAISDLASEESDFLSLLSQESRNRVLGGSRRSKQRAGITPFRAGDPPKVFVVEQGLVRGYWVGPDGEQATLVYLHSGSLNGGATTLVTRKSPQAFSQVVVDSIFIELDAAVFRKLAHTELEITRAVATHVAAMFLDAMTLIAVRTLGNVRERLAHDLLERACRCQLASGELEAKATHADLAHSIGSSREAVTRALVTLRKAEIVSTTPGRTIVRDPVRLAAIVRRFVI
jgi:CRP-like cAMP-binding protein